VGWLGVSFVRFTTGVRLGVSFVRFTIVGWLGVSFVRFTTGVRLGVSFVRFTNGVSFVRFSYARDKKRAFFIARAKDPRFMGGDLLKSVNEIMDLWRRVRRVSGVEISSKARNRSKMVDSDHYRSVVLYI
jgi:hypothetical protein